MTAYFAPTRDMQFVINELAGLNEVTALPAFAEQEVNPELVEAVLEEAAKLATEVLAPLNKTGDILGARLDPQKGVIPADGFAEAQPSRLGPERGLGAHSPWKEKPGSCNLIVSTKRPTSMYIVALSVANL